MAKNKKQEPSQYLLENIGFRDLLRRSLAQGCELAPIMVVKGYRKCLKPFVRRFKNTEKGFVQLIKLECPCRQCSNCLRLRQYLWRRRARVELQRHAKAWFVTLTYKPLERLRILYEAQSDANKGCSPDKKHLYDDLWRFLVASSGRDVAKFLKRVRKSQEKIRILFVAEKHKDGFPHWHGLIFGENITKDQIERYWDNGFTKVKLVRDVNAIDYVTKYISKERDSRIRASLHFGRPLDAVPTRPLS